jgi:hypothetical protein
MRTHDHLVATWTWQLRKVSCKPKATMLDEIDA